MKCPACKKGILEPIRFKANCTGNQHAAWCPKCKTSINWHIPYTGRWFERSLEYLCQ